MPRVNLEVIPWLTSLMGRRGEGRVVLVEDVPEDITVGQFLQQLRARWPEMVDYAVEPATQRLTTLVSIILNDRLLELLDGLETRLREGDTIILLPAYSGGGGGTSYGTDARLYGEASSR